MPTHTCERCGRPFKQKSHLTAHLKRKRPCVKATSLERLIETKVDERVRELIGENSGNIPETTALSPAPTSSPITFIKPPLKWAGGKTQLLNQIHPLFPKEIRNYQEPFLGAGSVLLCFLKKIKTGKITLTGKVYASDLNPHIIALFQNIKNHPEDLITQCKSLVDTQQNIKGTTVNRKPLNDTDARTSKESFYFWIRHRFNELSPDEKTTPLASAMLIFLNKTCFRGLYREGPRGFNVPFGNYKNPQIIDASHIMELSQLIQGVVFTVASFKESLRHADRGDFIYMDPPQAPEKTTSFVAYTKNGFNLEDHKLLFQMCAEFTRKNIQFLLSNADVSIVKDAFPDTIQKIQTISCRRAINSRNPEAKTNEVLISNYNHSSH